MSLPTAVVAWSPTTGPKATPSWSTITSQVRAFSCKRGRQHELDRFAAGTGALILDNSTRTFDRWADSNVKPLRRFRIQATWASVTYDLHHGFAEGYPLAYPGGANDSLVRVSLADGFKPLNLVKLSATYASQRSDVRIGAVLDSAGWPTADRSLRTGQSTLQGSTLDAEAALSHIQKVIESETGRFFINGQGYATFHDRHAPLTVARMSQSQGIFGDTAATSESANRLADPGAESAKPTWSGATGAENACTGSQSTTQVRSGTYSLKLLTDGTSTADRFYELGTTAALNDGVPGQKYNFRAWVYVPSGQGITLSNVFVRAYDVAGTQLTADSTTPNSADAWQQLSGTITLRGNTTQCFFRLYLNQNVTNVSIYWDDLELVQEYTELPYVDLVPSYDDSNIWNDIQVTRTGGTKQTATDATSQSDYYARTWELSGLLHTTDAESLDAADWLLAHYKDPGARFSSLVLDPQTNDAVLLQCLLREIGDRVTVKLTPPGGGDRISQDCWIEGIEHRYSGKSWRTLWQLSPADVVTYWILNDAVLGLLGTTSRLAY